jgi:PhzF family phenazine biosynthesis protein
MASHSFQQVDVFTERPFFGNPVAVVLDADGISDAEMQRIAAWTNLSETTFVQAATAKNADYRLRIFHPRGELPFAGHPTVGSAHAILEAGLVAPKDDVMRQECGAGVLRLSIEGEGADRRIFVEAPEAKLVGEYAGIWRTLHEALGRPIGQWAAPTAICNGPTWLFVRFDDTSDVAALQPDMPRSPT